MKRLLFLFIGIFAIAFISNCTTITHKFIVETYYMDGHIDTIQIEQVDTPRIYSYKGAYYLKCHKFSIIGVDHCNILSVDDKVHYRILTVSKDDKSSIYDIYLTQHPLIECNDTALTLIMDDKKVPNLKYYEYLK